MISANAVILLCSVAISACSQSNTIAFTSLQPHNVKVQETTYKGKSAIRVIDAMDAKAEGESVAVLTNTSFSDGTIEVEMAGEPGPGAVATARGFVGLAFRIAADVSGIRMLLFKADQRTRGRSGPPQSLRAVRLVS